MNEYRYVDLSVGDSEGFSYLVTADHVASFRGITGDLNPLHTDSEFAKSHGFDNNVVYGFLTASLMSTLAGVYLPGKYCVIHQIESCKFLRPVFVGDVLSVRGTVKELHDAVQQVAIKVEITNQSNEKVVRGILKIGFVE